MLGSTQFWNGIRPRATSAMAPTSAWRAAGTRAIDAATLPPRTSTVNFENANSRSRSWRRLRRPNAISIPLGSSVGAFDGGSGLIRIYHGREGWIDFSYRNIEQPQWVPLLAFIHETTERFLPAPAEMPGDLRESPTRIANRKFMEEKRPLRRRPEDHHFWSLIMLALTAA